MRSLGFWTTTQQSVRVTDIPQFLTKETEMYVNRCYGLPDNERLFPIVAEALQQKLKLNRIISMEDANGRKKRKIIV